MKPSFRKLWQSIGTALALVAALVTAVPLAAVVPNALSNSSVARVAVSTPVETGFDPANEGTIGLRLAAFNYDTSTGAVTDAGPNGKNATQASSGNRPGKDTTLFNGHASFDFDGTDDFLLVSSMPSMTEVTWFVPFVNEGAGSFELMGTALNSFAYYVSDGDGYFGTFRGTRVDNFPHPMTTAANGRFHVLEGISSASEYRVFLDGVELLKSGGSSASADYATGTHLVLGAGESGFATNYFNYFKGKVGEFLVYNGTLSSGHRTAVREGLASLYRPAPAGALLVFDGNSITRGYNQNGNPYPSQVLTLLGTPAGWEFHNFGLDGQDIDDMAADAAAQIDGITDSHFFAKQILVALEFTNQLIAGDSAATCLTKIKAYCAARRAAGYYVIVCTMLPATYAGIDETKRGIINTELRNGANLGVSWDAVADIAADARIGDAGDQNDPTYYGGAADGVHPNETGAGVMAAIVKAKIDLVP